jgi:hypothetical protein
MYSQKLLLQDDVFCQRNQECFAGASNQSVARMMCIPTELCVVTGEAGIEEILSSENLKLLEKYFCTTGLPWRSCRRAQNIEDNVGFIDAGGSRRSTRIRNGLTCRIVYKT